MESDWGNFIFDLLRLILEEIIIDKNNYLNYCLICNEWNIIVRQIGLLYCYSCKNLKHLFEKCPNLKNLNLYNNQIGDEGAKVIGNTLATNNSLQILYLYNNQIGDEVAKLIGNALATNTSLQILYLDNN